MEEAEVPEEFPGSWTERVAFDIQPDASFEEICEELLSMVGRPVGVFAGPRELAPHVTRMVGILHAPERRIASEGGGYVFRVGDGQGEVVFEPSEFVQGQVAPGWVKVELGGLTLEVHRWNEVAQAS